MNGVVVRRVAEAGYTAGVVCLAVLGTVRENSAPFYLLAVALTLPFGIAALMAIYGGYGLMSGIGGVWAPTTRPDGSQAAWLGTGSAVLNVVALSAAALAEVVLLEWWLRRRRPARVRA